MLKFDKSFLEDILQNDDELNTCKNISEECERVSNLFIGILRQHKTTVDYERILRGIICWLNCVVDTRNCSNAEDSFNEYAHTLLDDLAENSDGYMESEEGMVALYTVWYHVQAKAPVKFLQLPTDDEKFRVECSSAANFLRHKIIVRQAAMN